MNEFLDKKTYVKQAENVIGKLKRDKFKNAIAVSYSQLRNILALMNELYNAVLYSSDEKLNDDMQSRIQYVKMKIVYAAGRDMNVKDFVTCSDILNYMDMMNILILQGHNLTLTLIKNYLLIYV